MNQSHKMMKSLTHLNIMALALATGMMSGCQSVPFSQPSAKQLALPTNAPTNAPPTAANAHVNIAATTGMPNGVMTSNGMPNGDIAQVGYLQNNCGPNGCGPLVGSRPLGGAAANIISNGPIRRAIRSGGCGCGSCGASTEACSSPETQGYVEFAAQGWNAYGVDAQEFICDGGDNAPRAHLSRSDQVIGLQPEDTVVHYTTEAGDIKFQPSNKACVYSPRFNSIRKTTGAIAGERVVTASLVDLPVGPDRILLDLPGLVVADSAALGQTDVTRRIDALRDRNRGMRLDGDVALVSQSNVLQVLATLKNLGTEEMLDEQKAIIQTGSNAAIAWTIAESVDVAIEDLKAPVLTRDQVLDALVTYEFPDAGRLRIVKMADKYHAPSGDEVGFAIRVENVGDSAVRNVVVTDNLITRLEYVADSETCDRDADFKTKANSGQSLELQWKITEELEVGDSALIEFRCLVR